MTRCQADSVSLLQRSQCRVVLRLFLDFRHDTEIMADYGARYERCNVAMRYVG